jgi:hypothetical protein
MGNAILVREQIDYGKRLIACLDKSKFTLVGALWLYYPNSDEWKLLFISPLVDLLGPKRCYDIVIEVLEDLGITLEVLNEISLLSPKDSLFQLLRRAIRAEGISEIRFAKNTINNTFIEDALIYRLC